MALQIRHTQAIRCVYVGYRPAYGPPALHLPRAIWRGIVEAPTDVSQAEEVQPIGKGSRGRRTRRTPPPCPLRTTSLKARFPPEHSPWFVLPINFAPVGGRARTTPRGIGFCNPLVLANRLLHNLYIQAAGHKDCDIISERGNPCRKRASKRDTAQDRTCPLIPKPAEQGLQREDLEKRRQRAALPDRTLVCERPRTPSVHLHHCLRVVVHHGNPSAELRLESDSLQNSRQKPIVNPIESLGLI